MTMRSMIFGCVLALNLIACTSFTVNTPNRFVSLKDQTEYDYRATTPDGMVLGVRAIDNDVKGDLAFWSQALELRLQGMGGYALIEKKDVEAGALKGVQLSFGHDEGQRPHVYQVVLFVNDKRIFLLEAGGERELFKKYAADVDGWVKSFQPS
jgi:hypothetical protein